MSALAAAMGLSTCERRHPTGQPPAASLVHAAREAKGELRATLADVHRELPPAYGDPLVQLERERPDGAGDARWRGAIEDGRRLLETWAVRLTARRSMPSGTRRSSAF